MRSARSRLWWWFLTFAVVVTVVYVILPPSLWADLALYDGIAALTVVAIIAGVLIFRPPQPVGWLLIAAGNFLWLAGELSWSYLDASGQDAFPSFADYFYLAAYPLVALGLLLLVRAYAPVRDRFGVLDAAILASAAALLSWQYLMEPYGSDAEFTLSEKVGTLSYPVMDLLLLAVAARLVLGLGVRTRSVMLLGSALVLELGADSVYGWQEYQGTYESGGLLDGARMIGYALMGAAALHPSMAERPSPAAGQRFHVGIGRLAILAIAALVGPAMLIAQATSGDGELTPAVILVPVVATAFVLVVLRMGGLVATARELTKYRSDERFEAMVKHSADVVASITPELEISYASPAVSTVYGVEPQDCVGTSVDMLVVPEDRDSLRSRLEGVWATDRMTTTSFSGELTRSDGTRGHFEAVAANTQRAAAGVVLTVRDVTEQAELERQLSHQAFHDSPTQLPNRALFIDRVDHALSRAERADQDPLAVLFIDLDDLKSVNDGLGHVAGDELLLAVGERLRGCIRAGDTIARLGGDEFAILAEGGIGLLECTGLAERMLEVLRLHEPHLAPRRRHRHVRSQEGRQSSVHGVRPRHARDRV